MTLTVLLLEPYYGGSHKAWADGYRQRSQHHIELLTLPAQFWKWRMQGGAVSLARLFHERQLTPDVILASDMFDLATFRALTRECRAPVALYFHENQLTYPQNSRQQHGWQYGFINYASALAADTVYFNSRYHRDVFLDELPRMLKHFADYQELHTVDQIREKSAVLPLGLDLQRLDAYRPVAKAGGQPPLLLWNHRWEEDKNPCNFFRALYALVEAGVPFRVALLGENFRQNPTEFEEARVWLGDRVVHYGYAADFATYARLLWEADYVISTAYHDFFGIAMAEAMYCGCVPLLPRRLNYPDLIPAALHPACLYKGEALLPLLLKHLRGEIHLETQPLQAAMRQYDWSNMATVYDDALNRLVLAR